MLLPYKFLKIFTGYAKQKCAKAHVVLSSGSGLIYVNGCLSTQYNKLISRFLKLLQPSFPHFSLFHLNFNLKVIIGGGGYITQRRVLVKALARTFLKIFPSFFTSFKHKQFLTTDTRIKERKKYGLKKARKAPQYSKR